MVRLTCLAYIHKIFRQIILHHCVASVSKLMSVGSKGKAIDNIGSPNEIDFPPLITDRVLSLCLEH